MDVKSDLLKEAIADAKAVKETALANAKIALEEAFAPRIQSMLSTKISEEMDEADKMMFREEDDYKAFFKKAMKKFNVSDIGDMNDDDKKDFFNYVDRNYKAKKETD